MSYPQDQLEAVGCECDPADLRPELRSPGIEYVFVENHQNPYEEDPDYNIWAYVVLASGDVLVMEYKNTWKVTRDAIADLAAGPKGALIE